MMRKHSDTTVAVSGAKWKRRHTFALMGIINIVLLVQMTSSSEVRLLTWLSIISLLILLVFLVGHGVTGLWLGVLIDSRNKVSLSRLQMLLWTVLILASFLTAVLSNVEQGDRNPIAIHIPLELGLLMGINTLSLIGSPLILNMKKRCAANEAEKDHALEVLARQAVDISRVLIHGQVIVNHAPEAARLSDLFRGSETGNAGQLDMGKLQVFLFTLIVLFAYSAALAALFNQSAASIAALPAPDSGMLTLLGISHTGYLVNKAIPHSQKE
jgi:hypothetical protein